MHKALDFRQRNRRLQRLLELSAVLNSTMDIEKLLQAIISTAADVLECEATSLLLYDDKKQHLFFAASTGSDAETLSKIPVPLENSIAGTIFTKKQFVIVNDVPNEPSHFDKVSQKVGMQVRSLVGVPLQIHNRTTGVLEAINKFSGAFNDFDAHLLSILASHAAVAITNARMVQELQKAYQKVSDADRLKSNFLALASHELRTPLGIIIGYATFLQEDAHAEIAGHANQVMEAAMQMRTLIEEMTNLAVLKSNGIALKPETISIKTLIDEAGSNIIPLMQAKKQIIEYWFDDESAQITVDCEKMGTALGNILNNAFRFTPSGGTIKIGTQTSKDQIVIWVSDSGIGLTPDQIDKVFEEYYQAEHHLTRKQGGMGIGLAIAKGLIEKHGGQIWAESDGINKGTTFKVLLQRAF